MRATLSRQARLLVDCVDPVTPLPRDVVDDPGRLRSVAAAAARHGALPILLRKLRGEKLPLPPDWTERSTFEAGQALLLRHHGQRLMTRFTAKGIAARIVKGPVFADRLYLHSADRPFTDIDVMVRPQQMGEVGSIMRAAGFDLPAGEKASATLQEYKWFLTENPSLLVEVHGDLVHLPGLRRRFSLGFEHLASIDAGEVDAPPTLLMIAVIHATGGHKFHRLQLLVDVLQAVRALRSTDDEERAIEAAHRRGAALEFATVLDVTHRLFGDERAGRLARRATSTMPSRMARWLITPSAILDAGAASGWRSRLRRDAFRWVQRIAAAR